MTSYLARFGETLVKNGYAVIPIVAGTKRPPGWMSHKQGDPWSAVEPSLTRVRQWAADTKRLPGAGVGINLGRSLLAIDIDVLDEALATQMRSWCEDNLPAFPPVRIGRAPKSLLLFRTETPIRKMASAEWLFADGSKAQVEALGEGEQFVAYAVHPDTGKPYAWPEADLIDTPLADLPLINIGQVRAAIAAFDGMCEGRGLTRKGAAKAHGDDDDWTSSVDPGIAGIDPAELKRLVFCLANDGVSGEADFDTWLQVGMALYHETEGEDRGLELWTEWSAQSSKHVQAECERRWRSFDVSDKERRPITGRWLIKVAGGIRREKAQEKLKDIKAALDTADNEAAVRAAAEKIKTLDIDPVEREVMALAIQKKLRKILDAPIGITMARAMVKREDPNDVGEPPAWLTKWVYITSENVFFNRLNGEAMKPEAFDNAFARVLLTPQERREGKVTSAAKPSDVALNLYQIPVVDRRIYAPFRQEDIFDFEKRTCVNTYSDIRVPEIPTKLTTKDRDAIALIQRHIAWLIPDQRERDLFISFLAHVAARRGRVRWAVVLHGIEGVGKTFFFELMANLLGAGNVRTISPTDLGKEFSGWAEGSQFTVIEEIKLHGHSRYDVMNSLKPHITNDHVSIRRMRTDAYMAPNTATYMALTNFADALPLDDRDRRYMVISTAPTKADVQALEADYFVRLFDAARAHAGAILGWLTTWTPHPEFQANGRAPNTAGKEALIAMVESDDLADIREVIDEEAPRPGLTRGLLLTNRLTAALEEAGKPVPVTSRLNRILSDAGMTLLGRLKIDGGRFRVWSDKPGKWRDKSGRVDISAVREWLDPDL